jgi:hypothetical protein
MISSRGGRNRSSWRSSRSWLIGLPDSNLAVEGITDRPNRETQTARKPACTPGFLAKSITCSGQIIAIDQSLPNSSRTTIYRTESRRKKPSTEATAEAAGSVLEKLTAAGVAVSGLAFPTVDEACVNAVEKWKPLLPVGPAAPSTPPG